LNTLHVILLIQNYSMHFFSKIFFAIIFIIASSFMAKNKYSNITWSAIAVDSVEIGSFEIEIELSAKATKALKDKKESVIVTAYFSGIPKDTSKYLSDGEYPVGSKSIELRNSKNAKFTSLKITKAAFESLADKDVAVLINIYSGRRSSKLNILDGGILQKKISEMKDRKFVMKVKLIGE